MGVMGLVSVKLKVKNPKDERKFIEDDFLVDSGAQYSVIPEAYWKKLKLKPVRIQEFALADGRIIKRKVGLAFFEYKKFQGAAPVVLGKKKDSNLMGATTLESMGLGFNPFARSIYETKLINAAFIPTSTT